MSVEEQVMYLSREIGTIYICIGISFILLGVNGLLDMKTTRLLRGQVRDLQERIDVLESLERVNSNG